MAISPLLTLALLLGPGCGSKDAETPAADPKGTPAEASVRPSLVVITLDTTRVDRIGAYGYSGAHTPALDAMAQRGARFTRAYATVPLTTPSHASMFSGLYPTRHGIRTNGDAILPDDVTTLAEVLKGEGYRTAASVSAFVTTRIWNLDQGFDAYFDTVHGDNRQGGRWGQERPAVEVVDDAVAWLQDTQADASPFFLWVHFYDAHDPHRPPAEWAEKMPNRPYDAEIASVDEQIGRLRTVVDQLQGPGGTTWIALADHGEAMGGEHGEQTHGTFLFDSTMHIPFIIEPAKGLEAPKAIADRTVSGVDLMPTALGLLGAPVPDGLDGVDLSPAITGATPERPGVYMESYTVTQRFGYHPELALAEGDLKLMDTPAPRLFDLRADPKEATNLAEARPEDVSRMRAQVKEIVSRSVDHEATGPMAPEIVEQLEALGYMGAGNALDTALTSTIDAKDRLDTIRGLDAARQLSQNPEKLGEAEAKFREILANEPQVSEARLGLARLLERSGKMEESEAVLREALALEPDSTVLLLNLAQTLARTGRRDEALAQFELVLTHVPGDSSARTGALRMLSALARDQEALDRAEAWLAQDPNDASVHGEVALIVSRRGDLRKAEEHAQKSLADSVPRPFIHEILARGATARGKLDEVEVHLKAELDAMPINGRARWALGNLYMTQKKWEDAAAEYQFLAEMSEKGPPRPPRGVPTPEEQDIDRAAPVEGKAGASPGVDARRAWAQAIFNGGDYQLAFDTLAPALAAAPQDPHVLLLQANILAKLGREEEGKTLFEQAQALRNLELQEQRRGR